MTGLHIAQVRTPVPGWCAEHQERVIHQVNALSPHNLEWAMGNQNRVEQIVGNQVAALPDGAPFYLDFEPGDPGWARKDVQDFAVSLLSAQPCYLFPGGQFASILDNPAEIARAQRVAGSASLGVIPPVYHGNPNVAAHLVGAKRRLDLFKGAGLHIGAVAVSRVYNDAVGPGLARTPVPLADFLAGVQLARQYADTVMVWAWLAEWEWFRTDELKTAEACA